MIKNICFLFIGLLVVHGCIVIGDPSGNYSLKEIAFLNNFSMCRDVRVKLLQTLKIRHYLSPITHIRSKIILHRTGAGIGLRPIYAGQECLESLLWNSEATREILQWIFIITLTKRI